MLLTAFNQVLKKSSPDKMRQLNALGLSVRFQLVNPNITDIDPQVMLTIYDSQNISLYTWHGENYVGGAGDLKDMANSMWKGIPAMLAMLQARHAYMEIVGTDLSQDHLYSVMCGDKPKTFAAWRSGEQIDYQSAYELVDDWGLGRLKDFYQQCPTPEMHSMAGTRAVVQLTGVLPLVAAAGETFDVSENEEANNDPDLRIKVDVDQGGLRFTLQARWMECHYLWENADMVAVLTWQELAEVFGLNATVFEASYVVNGNDFKDAFDRSLLNLAVASATPTVPLPADFLAE